MINVKNVSLKYPHSNDYTIKDVSFHVKRGEIFGFLGPSGAGKSTLQKILTGTLLILIPDKNITKQSDAFLNE